MSSGARGRSLVRRSSLALAASLALVASASPARAASPASPARAPTAPTASASTVDGRWTFEIPRSGQVETARVDLAIAVDEFGAVSGTVETEDGALPAVGTFDGAARRLVLGASFGGVGASLVAVRDGESLRGTLTLGEDEVAIVATRATDAVAPAAPVFVELSDVRPRAVSRSGLAREVASPVVAALVREIEAQQVVGLSCALVIGGAVVDVRHFGWEDVEADTPVSASTMYRWASISKPLTAVVALQLAREGALDLDADVRGHVPEYPEKRWPITSRQLLGHLGGVVHYRGMGLRPLRDYGVGHPWTDRIHSLDLFKAAPLLAEPGTRYSYTTPGFVLLGAVVERAGAERYDAQVRRRICTPLGMTTMQPDDPDVDIPHRTRGYARRGARIVDTGDDDVTWKLPAGGWISTVEDLARFGAGLMNDELLTAAEKATMWTRQRTRDGERTAMGLGIGVGTLDGRQVISHSGGQKKTSTFLIACPERGMAVALMCNTEGTRLSDVAREILRVLAAGDD